MNFIIEIYIFVSTKYERQSTNTDYELSVLFKLTFLKVMNTVLVTYVGNNKDSEWFRSHGLIEEVIFVVFFMNAGEIFRVIFNMEYLRKCILRKIESKKGDKSILTQRQANILYENDAIVVGKTMSVILVFTFTILFYSVIIPGLSIFGIFGAISINWILRILILRRKIVKLSINSKLFLHSV